MKHKSIIKKPGIFLGVVIAVAVLGGCDKSYHEQTESAQPAQPTEVRGLPEVAPVFAPEKKARQTFVLKTDRIVDKNGKGGLQPYFESGGKQVVFHQDMFRDFFKNPAGFVIEVNGKDVARINCSGWIPEVGGGNPFMGRDDSKGETTADLANQTVTFRKEIMVSTDKSVPFSYTLKSVGDGKLKLDWNLGLSPEEIAALPPRSNLRFDIIVKEDAARGGLDVDGKTVPLLSDEQLRARLEADGKRTFAQVVEGRAVRVGGEGSGGRLGVEADADSTMRIEESFTGRNHEARVLAVQINTKKLRPSGSLLLDLGKTAVVSNDAPPPVAGVDFWRHDRMDVPALPTRNLLPNPSFEQGLRYWTWRIRGGGSLYAPDTEAPPGYEITDDARFGRRALKINVTQGNRGIVTFPLPLVPGETYTLSLYSKGGRLRIAVVPALPTPGDYKEYVTFLDVPASPDWTRSTLVFKARLPAERLELEGGSACIVDALQVEQGDAATDFVTPPVEGWLVSADPDNSLEKGKPLGLALELTGIPGLEGEATLTVFDYYREVPFKNTFAFKLDEQGRQTLPVPADPERLGTGIFVARVDYVVQGESACAYTDYYRFSILDFLENTHPDKDIFGLGISAARITRGDDLGEMYKRWGFGSTTYGNGDIAPEFYEKHGIRNLLNQCTRAAFSPKWLDQPLRDIFFSWEEMTPEREKIVEDIAFKAASDPKLVGDVWAFNTESDGHTRMALLDRYDEFITLQMAARRGVKRARPNAIVLPDGGTSGFQPGRGYLEMEKQLKASQGRVKWDGLAIHPYGRFDDMDDSIKYLIGLDEKYNPGDNTPIYIPECSPGGRIHVPEWEKFSQYYVETSGRPSYDTGWREFDGTAISARLYLIGLKYWPRVRDINQWVFRPFLDMYFAPEMLCGTTNTLGHLLPNPKFIADYEPIAGIKGLIFEDDQQQGLAAVWANAPKVEDGVEKGPGLRIRTEGSTLQFIDIMGNVRTPEVRDGVVVIPLSPAPLFIRTQPGGAAMLAETLQTAEIMGSGSVAAVSFLPTTEGNVAATITNRTATLLSGVLAGEKGSHAFDLQAKASEKIGVSEVVEPQFGGMISWKGALSLELSNGYRAEYRPHLAYFYVPRTAQPLPLDPNAPAWAAIPSIPVTNFHAASGVSGGQAGDLQADFKAAWDDGFFYLRVECRDDKFLADMEAWTKNIKRAEQLWQYDGCVEVYFDTFANGRSSGTRQLDNDDYCYDFYAKDGKAKNGPGSAYRLHEVFMEYAGGPSMPTMEEVQNGGIPVTFHREGGHYVYVMIFPQRYLRPLALHAGARTGFGLYIHDRDESRKFKGLSLATEQGQPCNLRPDLWPIMILSDQTAGESK